MKIKNPLQNKGFTMVELLIYVSGLLVLGSVIIVLILQFFSLYKEIVAAPRADRTGLLIIDRITKEIRSAQHIDMLESQFNTSNGVITILDKNNIKKRFFVEHNVAKLQEDDEITEISSDDFNVTNFNFYYVDTPVSEGVRFSLELEYTVNNETQTKSYVGFALIRSSYE